MAARETGFLKLVDEATPAPAEAAALLRKAFPEPYAAAWLRAVAKLRDAGYGQSVVGTYELHGPRIALLVGPDQKFLSTTGFLDKIDENLRKAMTA